LIDELIVFENNRYKEASVLQISIDAQRPAGAEDTTLCGFVAGCKYGETKSTLRLTLHTGRLAVSVSPDCFELR